MRTSPKITDLCGPEAYEAMLYEIADECCDPQNPGCVAVMGPDTEFNDLYDEFVQKLADAIGYGDKEAGLREARRAVIQVRGFTENGVASDLQPSFANRVMTEVFCDLHHKGQKKDDGSWRCPPRALRFVVSLFQDVYNRERFLPFFTSRCPEVRVYFVDLLDPASLTITNKITRRDGSVETLFDTREEFDALGDDLAWVVEGFAHEEEITVVGGLPKDFKTWFLLSVVQALLTGEPLFGYFRVPKLSEKVLYLIPEASRRSFYHRLKVMKLDQFLDDTLFVRTLSKGPAPTLDDPAIITAAKGADVFLDTVSRFATGDENAASDVKNFSAQLFRMLEAGARSVWAAHHSPKAFGEASKMTLENMLRGSGDIGAMLSNAYGLRKLDEDTGLVHVECLAGRDLPEPVKPFQLRARPYLNDEGRLVMVKKPGEAGTLGDYVSKKTGRPGANSKEEKLQMVLSLKEEGKSLREIEELTGVKKSTVADWLSEHERDQDRPEY